MNELVTSKTELAEEPARSLPRCDVWLGGHRIARLYREGDFRHLLVYEGDAKAEDFVSLIMPVRPNAWEWPELHPFFRMNLPEGYQLSLLREAFGPRLDGTDLTLLGLIGANTIGRIKVVPKDQKPNVPTEQFDLSEVLKGDNSEEEFQELLKRFLVNAVSGVMPKFLSPPTSNDEPHFRKASLVTSRAIVKGSSKELPYLALNEHLTMQVARAAGLPTADTLVSEDGLALVVQRFDTNEEGDPIVGFEDFCSLLGLRPAEKYDTTWERIARALRDLTPAQERFGELERLVRHIVLTYAVRNADCHSKNVALIYSDRTNVSLAPTYDLVTTVAYNGYTRSPPGLSLAGRKTWQPGNSLPNFAQSVCGIGSRRYAEIVEQTCDAVADVAPQVVRATLDFEGFHEIGKRMLLAWRDGTRELTKPSRTMSSANKRLEDELEAADFSPTDPEPATESIGRSPLLGKRR